MSLNNERIELWGTGLLGVKSQHGVNHLELDYHHGGKGDYLYQDVTTKKGQLYEASFYIRARRPDFAGEDETAIFGWNGVESTFTAEKAGVWTKVSAIVEVGIGGENALTAEEALGISWWSGIVVLIVCLSGATNALIRLVPSSIKHGIVVGMGLLIAMIGMVSVKMIVSNPSTLVELGDIGDSDLQLCFVGILLLASLLHHNVQGAILIGIFAMTMISWWIHGDWPSRLVKLPVVDEFYWTPEIAWNWALGNITFPAIGAFALICIFDISGVLFGLTTLAGIRRDGEDIPGAFHAFIASGVGTLIAAILGSTPIIVCVECAAGIREGGKTGLTAVVMGFYFLLSIFLAPLFQSVPVVATAPVLVLVGVMMMGESAKVSWSRMTDALPAFLTMLLMPLTYSITNGMLIGLISAAGLYFITGRFFNDVTSWYQASRRDQSEDDGEKEPWRNGEKEPLASKSQAAYESA